jgi:transcriptional regulator with XRE-family HTH domain
MKEAKKNIPNNLKKFRTLMGYSQEDVHKKLGLKTRSVITKWESGTRMPGGENLLKLSVLYKTLANELYYTLTKEIQAALYPHERTFIRVKKKKQRRRTDRAP